MAGWRDERHRTDEQQGRSALRADAAERALVGACLLRGSVAEIAELDDHDLWLPDAAAAVRAMRMVVQRGEAIDYVSVDDQLRRTGEAELVGGLAGLAKFDRYAHAGSTAHWVAIVREAAARRRLVEVGRAAIEAAAAPEGDFVAACESAIAALRSASLQASPTGLVSMRDACVRAFRRLEEFADPNASPLVRTGWATVDAAIGGIRPAEFVLLGAASGHGKTAAGVAIALSQVFDHGQPRGTFVPASTPKWTLFASNEVSDRDLAMRCVSAIARVNGALFRAPTPAAWGRARPLVIEGFAQLAEVPITWAHRPHYHLEDFLADARRWHRTALESAQRAHPHDDPRAHIGPIIADYLQLWQLRGDAARQPREQQVAAIAKAHVDLAVELDVPVIALAQVSEEWRVRDDERARPRMHHIRESRAAVFHAHAVLMLWRPERLHPQHDARRLRLKELLALQAAHARGGPALTGDERAELQSLYRATLVARLAVDKFRDGPADDVFELEFTGEFARFLDAATKENA